MRKANQEIKDEKILDEILSGVTICRVAMMDGELPYIIPFNYGYSDGCLYIHSAPERQPASSRATRACSLVDSSGKA